MLSLAARVAARGLVGQTTRVEGDGYAKKGLTLPVAASRPLNASDNGLTLEATATITLTVPEGLPDGFRCKVIPLNTTSIARSGTALINGAGTTLTRAAATAANALIEIAQKASVANSYTVTGA